jgi:hypothetical protein
VKGGVEYQENTRFINSLTIGDTKSTYTSLANGLSGFTANQIDVDSLSGSKTFRVSNVSDFGGFIRTINGLPNRAAYYAAFDTNSDGTISAAEFGASALYNSTTGNPHSAVNYGRTFQSADGPQEFVSKGTSFFIFVPARPAHHQCRCAHRAVGALRHDRRQHHDLRLGVRAAVERGLRCARQRPAESLGVLGPLLRSGPHQHDRVCRLADRADA